MRAFTFLACFLTPLINASTPQQDESLRSSVSWPPAGPQAPSATVNASIPSPTLAVPEPMLSQGIRQNIPDHLAQFLLSFDKDDPIQDSDDLRKRQQGGVGGGNGAPPASIPTQLSPVTVYFAGSAQVTYTQTFPPTPIPWAAPSTNGQIGMGTLTGKPGAVKTGS